MISLTVEKRYGAATVRTRVTAPSVEQALRLCGGDARVVSPMEPEHLSAANGDAGPANGPSTLAAHARAEAA